MAGYYLSVYRDLPFVQVVACVDASLDAARKAADFLSARLATSEFPAALAPEVDAVIISTPNHLHRQQAVAAIEAGKHVLLQKPVAANLDDAEAILAAAQRSARTIGLYMSYFDQPLMHDLRDLVQQKRLGEIVHCYARLMHKGGMIQSSMALQGQRTWRTSLAQTGGGCFIQVAVHYIHIFEWMLDSRIARATARTANLHCPGVEGEDLALAILEFENGAMATIDTSWCTNGEQLSLHGTRGRAEYRNAKWLAMASGLGPFRGRVIDYPGGMVTSYDGGHGAEHQAEITPPGFGDAANPLNQHRTFLEAARDGRPAFCSIASGVDDLRVVKAVYDSARTGTTVEVRRAPR